MPRVTLWGFYQYDSTLFDGVVLPDGINKEILVSEIMRNSGDLYPYHQIPQRLKYNINRWFAQRLFDFARMYEALRAEYSPIENYDRTEDLKRELVNSGQDRETTTLGSATTTKHTGDDTTQTQVSAYNEAGFTNRDKETLTYNTVAETSGKGSDTNTTVYGHKRTEKEENRIHGNIGVTTSQQMIIEELEMRTRYDIYKIIAREFEYEFLIQVY